MKLFTRLAMTIFIATFVPIALLGLIMRGFLSYANFTLMTVAVGLLLTAGLYMSIIRPLDELKQGINRVKQGDLDFTLEAENEDEIGELTTAFEEMRIRLRESNEEKLQYDVLKFRGPVLCEVFVSLDQPFEPGSAVKKHPDGSLSSPPLEDLKPFLSEEELEKNMFIARVDEG